MKTILQVGDDPNEVFFLQSTSNVAGSYADVPSATPPYTNDLTASAQQFFRLRQY